MRAHWQEKNNRWACSSGKGRERRWWYSRLAGEEGRKSAESKMRRALEGDPSPDPGTLAWFIERMWWPTVTVDAAFRTKQSYKSIVDNHFVGIDQLQIKDLRLPVLQAWVAKVAEGRTPKTVQTIFGVMTGILNLAAKTGDYPYRDHELVRLPRISKTEKQGPDDKECTKILAAAAGTRFEGPVWAAMTLGLRRGEALGLKVAQIKLLDGKAVVSLEDNRQQHGEEKRLKSKAAGQVRRLTIPREWGEKLLGYACPGSIYLFTNLDGSPLSPSALTSVMPELCKRAGTNQYNYHALRHAMVTRLRKAGASAEAIQRICGHTTAAMTEGYGSGGDELVFEAFRRLTS